MLKVMSIYKRFTFTGMLRLLAQIHDSMLAQAPFFIGSSQCVCMFSELAPRINCRRGEKSEKSHRSTPEGRLYR